MVEYLDKVGLSYLWGKMKTFFATKEELSLKQDALIYKATSGTSGTAAVTTSPYCASIWRVDLSNQVTELYTGLTILYKIPVAGNGSYGTLLRIDGVDANDDSNVNLYPVCINVTTMISTRYAVGCIIALTFDADQYGQTLYYKSASKTTTTANGTGWAKKGCWKISDYNSDTDYSYRLRYGGSAGTYVTLSALYRYKLLLQKNETTLIPVNSDNNKLTTDKVMTTEAFNPFGLIAYYNSTTNVSANGNINPTYIYRQVYGVDIRHSFNVSALVALKDVYMVCVPQSDGMVKLADNPIAQELPSVSDGKLYIYLGHMTSTTLMEFHVEHPIYEYRYGSIRIWTGLSIYMQEVTQEQFNGIFND